METGRKCGDSESAGVTPTHVWQIKNWEGYLSYENPPED